MGAALGALGSIASCASCASCLSSLAPVVSIKLQMFMFYREFDNFLSSKRFEKGCEAVLNQQMIIFCLVISVFTRNI